MDVKIDIRDARSGISRQENIIAAGRRADRRRAGYYVIMLLRRSCLCLSLPQSRGILEGSSLLRVKANAAAPFSETTHEIERPVPASSLCILGRYGRHRGRRAGAYPDGLMPRMAQLRQGATARGGLHFHVADGIPLNRQHWYLVAVLVVALTYWHVLACVHRPVPVHGGAHQMLHDALAREVRASDKPHRRSKTGRRYCADKIQARHGGFEVC